jgi:hypothetical protein
MLGSSATSVTMVTTTSLNACVSHALQTGIESCLVASLPNYGTGLFFASVFKE